MTKRFVPYQPEFCLKADQLPLEEAERLLREDLRVESMWRDRTKLWLRGPLHDVLRVKPKRMQDTWRIATDLRKATKTKGFLFFDVDHSQESRWMHSRGLWSMCRLRVGPDGPELKPAADEDRWTYDYPDPGLRTLRISVQTTVVGHERALSDPLESIALGEEVLVCPRPGDAEAEKEVLRLLGQRLHRIDPDVLVTHGGDGFELPFLLTRIHALGLQDRVWLGRDPDPAPSKPDQAGKSIHTYGRWLYKTPAYYLRGRWHVDLSKKSLDSEEDREDIQGILYLARVSNRRAQDINRNGPGFALQQMQIDLACDLGVALPWKRNLTEDWKDAATLHAVDRGSQIMVPTPGIYEDVAACDFSGYYPALVVAHNLSSDSLNCTCCPDAPLIPELDCHVCQRHKLPEDHPEYLYGHQAEILRRLGKHRRQARAVIRRSKSQLLDGPEPGPTGPYDTNMSHDNYVSSATGAAALGEGPRTDHGDLGRDRPHLGGSQARGPAQSGRDRPQDGREADTPRDREGLRGLPVPAGLRGARGEGSALGLLPCCTQVEDHPGQQAPEVKPDGTLHHRQGGETMGPVAGNAAEEGRRMVCPPRSGLLPGRPAAEIPHPAVVALSEPLAPSPTSRMAHALHGRGFGRGRDPGRHSMDRDAQGVRPPLRLPNVVSSLDLAKAKAVKSEHKALGVVCFGYFRYRNARFGCAEVHQAIQCLGRDSMTKAREIAQQDGFRMLHELTDCAFLQKKGATRADVLRLCRRITKEVRVPLEVEGIYRWLVLLPSKTHSTTSPVGVPNRYYGKFEDGKLKTRGIELRRHSTAPFLYDVQDRMLGVLCEAEDAAGFLERIPRALRIAKQAARRLLAHDVDPKELGLTIQATRSVEEYTVDTGAKAALRQLRDAGTETRPGQYVQYVVTRTEGPGDARARPVALLGRTSTWQGDVPDMYHADAYLRLLARQTESLFAPFGYTEEGLHAWLSGRVPRPQRVAPRPAPPAPARLGPLLSGPWAPR